MNYRTATISDGVTTEDGKFTYLEGETVTFYLGDLTFPAVKAAAQVTPADIGGGLATTTTVNILQLLQSLDENGDLSDGITISDASKDAFVGTGLDVGSDSFDADASAILTSISKTLVTEEDAQAHFTDTLKGQLTGSWLLSEGAGKRNVLTFFNDNNYIIVHEHSDIPDDGDQPAGSAEYGTYTYDPATQMLALNVTSESDNSGGLADDFGSITLEVQATQTTLDITFADEAGEQVQFSKITDSSNAMVGAWYLREDDISSDNILTILPNNQYVIVHSNNQEAYNGEAVMATSGEFGSFSLNGGVFTVTSITSEADGPGGLYDKDSPMFSATVTVTDNESLNFTNSDENFTFSRIK
ncbi:TPA: adhesin [Vibrio vulnificus]|nr:adhesin [Vibrio vulnificus]EHH0746760.1 adhesin [Vibrio vulnificus]HAS6061086.1 adhesin [Vibrio vulnificus]HAS6162148.1 adhesin [Vibrio vulnificus]HAS6184239.1 adhesin [Vibrio vulnificus]